MLKTECLTEKELNSTLLSILTAFSNAQHYYHPLNNLTYLVLSHDSRDVSNKKRYSKSPFPLLSILEEFSCTIGDWNEELASFGIKARKKYGDTNLPEEILGTRIHLSRTTSINQKSNSYLKRQYKRLTQYRTSRDVNEYWKLSWTLMCKSWSFRLACLNSWQPVWYKTLKVCEVKSLFKSLNRILTLSEVQTQIINLWLESPKGKWRQLNIPKPGWRYYFHMLNMFISYVYEPQLPSEVYDGFIYNRGCKSWWEGLIWGGLLRRYNHLVESDMSSGFPNLNLEVVKLALNSDGLIPDAYVNLIITHLKSPLTAAKSFPTFSSYVEHLYNKTWRQSNRSVPMGIGISPILYVITFDWCMRSLSVVNDDLVYKAYADDLSFYFNTRGFFRLVSRLKINWIWLFQEFLKGHNLLISILNTPSLFSYAGLKFCPQKSGQIKLFGLWLRPLRSLGLQLYTELPKLTQVLYRIICLEIPLELMGYTRGRASNPITGKPGTPPSRVRLHFKQSSDSTPLTYSLLIKDYRKYFGLLMSKLYSDQSITPNPSFAIDEQSYLWLVTKQKPNNSKLRSHNIHLDLYNSGSVMNRLFLSVNKYQTLEAKWHLVNPNLERSLRQKWDMSSVTYPTLTSDSLIPDLPPDYGYYSKFTELVLTSAELSNLKRDYERTKRS